MCSKRILNKLLAPLVSILPFVSFLLLSPPCFSQDASCSSARARWEERFQELRDRIQDYSTIQQTSLERLTQHPLVDRTEGKTIAKQISEAILVKDQMLSAKRKECQKLLALEDQAFAEFKRCAGSGRGSRDKEVRNLIKKRQGFVEKAMVALAEVREVEGKGTLPYMETMRNQDPYRQSWNNQWQNQQMYRNGWWGY
ncbi:MAG: hypothetical protein WBG50_00905 [Desulfomonilaceae bacterium]